MVITHTTRVSLYYLSMTENKDRFLASMNKESERILMEKALDLSKENKCAYVIYPIEVSKFNDIRAGESIFTYSMEIEPTRIFPRQPETPKHTRDMTLIERIKEFDEAMEALIRGGYNG